MPIRVEHDSLGTKSGSWKARQSLTVLVEHARSTEKLAYTYPKTSFEQNVNGILGTVSQYTVPNSLIEFIPIKPLAAMDSSAPGSCAGHNRVPSPDRGRLPSTSGCGLSQCGSA